MKSNMNYRADTLANLPQGYIDRFKEEKKYLEKNIPQDAKVLEIGCGDGRSISDIINITTNITGIDHDEKAIEDAKNHFQNNKDINIILGSAESLPFQDGEFDIVMCMTTFANFGEQKYIILDEMKRILKDNGKIIISVFGDNAMEERMKVYKSVGVKIKEILGGKVVFDSIAQEKGDYTSEQFSPDELRNIFEKTNLNVIDITTKGIANLCTLTK